MCKDLRQAIDYARGHIDEMPRCVACRFQLNETNRVKGNTARFHCPECATAFNWKPKPNP